MPQNNQQTPRQLQGGPSFTYSDRGSNRRKRPADIDEIIHFVRTQGITRETTEMRLNHKAPLPSIGHHMVAPTRHQNANNINASSVDTEGTDEAYEFDPDYMDLNPRTLSPTAMLMSSSHSNILSKSMEPQNFAILSPIKPIGGSKRSRDSLDPSPVRNVPNRRSVRTLPPMLQHERPIYRPSAPSPSVTPPLASSGEEEENEDFIET